MTNSPDYSSWTLKDLKQAAANSKLGSLTDAVNYFNRGATACQDAATAFMAQARALSGSWQGAAAQAANDNASSTQTSMITMQQSSAQASSATSTYHRSAQSQQAQVEAIPDVDTSFGHALSSGWWAGPFGVGVAAAKHQAEYDRNQKQAARVVTQMDSE